MQQVRDKMSVEELVPQFHASNFRTCDRDMCRSPPFRDWYALRRLVLPPSEWTRRLTPTSLFTSLSNYRMASFVHYRFRFQKDDKRINFDGTGISVSDVKREILTANNLNPNDMEVLLYDSSGDKGSLLTCIRILMIVLTLSKNTLMTDPLYLAQLPLWQSAYQLDMGRGRTPSTLLTPLLLQSRQGKLGATDLSSPPILRELVQDMVLCQGASMGKTSI